MSRDIVTEAGVVIKVKAYQNLVLVSFDDDAFALTARDSKQVARALLAAASVDHDRCRRCIRLLLAIIEGNAPALSVRDALLGARSLLTQLNEEVSDD